MSNNRNTSTVQTTGNRGLGLGFGAGNAFHLKSSEPNRGLINQLSFSKEFLSDIKTISRDSVAKKNTTLLSALKNAVNLKLDRVSEDTLDEIIKDVVALTLPDLLVDINIKPLAITLPALIQELPHKIKQLFEKYKLNSFNDNEGKRFLHSIIASKYQLFSGDDVETEISKKLNELNESLSIDKIDLIDTEIMAYLVPALIDRMDDNDLKQIAYAIASQLPAKYLLPIADEHYFVPEFTSVDEEAIKISNANKRSLRFVTDSAHTRVYFRNKEYTLQHAHVHFEKDGEENEYDLNGNKFDGEIHVVFDHNYKGNQEKKRLMAIGFPLKTSDTENIEIAKLLNSINQLPEIKQWRASGQKDALKLDMNQLDKATNFKELFMGSFEKAKNNDSLLFHSWASLRSDTYGFRQAGLRFVISPDPIEMTEAQYRQLKEIFGEMETELKEKDKLDPIDRKAGHRQKRVTLAHALEEKVTQLSTQRLLTKKI